MPPHKYYATFGGNENDKELGQYFLTQLDKIDHCTLLNFEPRDKLPKVTLTDQLKISANKLLSIYLINVDTIPEITDKLYLMGKAIGHKLGASQKQQSGCRRQKAVGGNLLDHKLNREMKELRKGIARISNELHRRKSRRKASRKEKASIQNLKTKLNINNLGSKKLRMVKEEWIDKLRYKKIQMKKYIERKARIQDNIMYQRDQNSFFKKLEGTEVREGKYRRWRSSLSTGGGIWERKERTPDMPGMEEVKRQLSEKVNIAQEFDIEIESTQKEVRKKKIGQHQELMVYRITGGRILNLPRKH